MQFPLMILIVVLVIGIALFVRAAESGHVSEQALLFADHYRQALAVLRRNRWLFIFPFLMTATESLLGLPMTLLAKHRQATMGLTQDVPAFHWASVDVFFSQAIRHIMPAFKVALRGSIAPAGIFIGGMWSVELLALITFIVLLLPTKPDWLLDATKTSLQQLRFLRTTACVSVAVMVVALVLFVATGTMMTTLALATFAKGILFFLPGYLLGLSQVWVIALITSIYCKAALNALEKNNSSFGQLFKEGLKSFPAMFAFELTLTILLVALQAIVLPTMGSVSGEAIQTFGRIREMWVEPTIRFLVVTVPFLIVVKNVDRNNILQTQTDFLKNHPLEYIVFVLSGLALLLIPAYTSGLVDTVVTPLSMPSFDVGILLSAFQSVLAAWYVVAFLDWIRQTKTTA